jgi:hypothetical protein
MLLAIVAADDRLYAKLGGAPSNPNAVFGLGYDADGDDQFALDDDTLFNQDGIAFTSPADLAKSLDPDDMYAEGWFTGFWHYGVESPTAANPYEAGNWSDTSAGMASRALIGGSWDSWTFSPTFNFAAYAENPVSAQPLAAPGDYTRDGRVDAADYVLWQQMFGSTFDLAADGNNNGTVDAADFVLWRHHFNAVAMNSPTTVTFAIPEPTSISLVVLALLPAYFQCLRTLIST